MTKSYNYIAFGNRDRLRNDNRDTSMIRGRMFEYTPSNISQGLSDLGGDSISYLESLLTLLCSEVNYSNGAVSMIVKFGRVQNIDNGFLAIGRSYRMDTIGFRSVALGDLLAAQA